MLQEYIYEIIALIVILTLIVIYFLTRKFKQDEENSMHKHTPKVSPNITETQSIPVEENIKVKDDEISKYKEEAFKFSGSEEGSFGSIKNNPFEEIEEETPKRNKRSKIDVPPHGKILKDNFKEFKGVKLLVAEDNMINQKVISGLLSGSGVEITMADDGQIALDILEENSDFDMILMDAHMPKVDGFEATRRIRANTNYEHIVVVALSGDIAPDDIRKMSDAGMEEHLEKPLRMDSFYDILYAYTKGNLIESEFIEVVMTKELNGDKGLQVCGGDDIFYKEILNEFTLTYTDATQMLTKLLDEKKIDLADAMLLDFIGITANIGAENIRDIALDLKETIKDLEEKSYITLLEDFEQHLEVLLKDIRRYL